MISLVDNKKLGICTKINSEKISFEATVKAVPVSLLKEFEAGVIIDVMEGLIEIRPNLPCSNSTYKEMIKILGSYKKAIQWFNAKNEKLKGKKPIDLYDGEFHDAEMTVDILLLEINT